MSKSKAPFEWKYVYIPFFISIILLGIVLTFLSTILPFSFFPEYYTERELRPIQSNQTTLQFISYSFGLVLTIGNSVFFCLRSQVMKAPYGRQLLFGIITLTLEAIVLFAVFFFAPRHQVGGYWLVPLVSIIGSAIYIVLCIYVFKPGKRLNI